MNNVKFEMSTDVKNVLTKSLTKIIEECNNLSTKDKKISMDTALKNIEINWDVIAYVLEEEFEIIVDINDFTVDKWIIGDDWSYYTYMIGTRKLEICREKSLNNLIEDILAAIYEELLGKQVEQNIIQIIKNDGMCLAPRKILVNLDEMGGIKGLISYLSKDRYCDENFKNLLKEMGYLIGTTSFHGICNMDYIEVKDRKVWLEVLNAPFTLYQECKARTRLEILYILEMIQFDECLFFEEL